MNKELIIKLTGAMLILLTIIYAILFGSSLEIIWDFSPFLMALTFIAPCFLSNNQNESALPFWGLLISGILGLMLMILNINEPMKLGQPMAFSLNVSLYIFIFLLVNNLFKKSQTNSSIAFNLSSKSNLLFFTLLLITLGFSFNHLGLIQIIDTLTISIFFGLVALSVLFRGHFQDIAEDIFITSLYSGAICFVISIIQILQNLSSSEFLIPALGNALLGVLYSFFTALISINFFNLRPDHIKKALFIVSSLSIYILEFILIKYVI